MCFSSLSICRWSPSDHDSNCFPFSKSATDASAERFFDSQTVKLIFMSLIFVVQYKYMHTITVADVCGPRIRVCGRKWKTYLGHWGVWNTISMCFVRLRFLMYVFSKRKSLMFVGVSRFPKSSACGETSKYIFCICAIGVDDLL